MKFKKLNSEKEVNVPLKKYYIDWEYKVSAPSFQVQQFLKPYWKSHCVLGEFRIPGSLLRIDITNINLRICIEVSPNSVHGEYNEFFHKSRAGFLESIKRDEMKRKWVEENKFKFVEVFDDDLEELSEKWFLEKYKIKL